MTKLPKWKKEFNQRMAAQLRLFANSKDCPKHLTKFTYDNGGVVIREVYRKRNSWGRTTNDYNKPKIIIQDWVRDTSQPSA